LAIILGCIGGGIATILISMLIFFYFLRRKKRGVEGQQELSSDSADGPPTGTARRFDPSFHTSIDWKHKHRSFLDVFANANKEKRATGDSLFSPRTPPKPFALAHQQSMRLRKDSNDSIESLRYTTTSERLERDRTTSFSSGSEVSFGLGVGTPKVGVKYLEAKDVTNISVVSPMTARTDMTSTHRGPGGLLEAINTMKREDGDNDPLETPSTIATGRLVEGDSYPFPPTPPMEKSLPRPPALKSRLSTKIPDSRFSSAVALPQPPVTPAYDFTLPPEEYRRKQSGVPKSITDDPRGSSTLPSLYEPFPGATRYSLSQRTEYSKRNSKRGSRGAMSDDGESLIFSASTDSRYPSFIPDAQTVQRVKGMFGLSNIQFPLPPSTTRVRRKSGGSASASGDESASPHEWVKAKSKAKLTQEVMNIGKKDPIVERGNENGIRKGVI
jgi:hypothetical protein